MHRAYARLAEVLPAAPPGLHLVRSVQLTFGAHEVLVKMPAVAGREAADAEVTSGGSVLDAVAASIVWLARKGVVYVVYMNHFEKGVAIARGSLTAPNANQQVILSGGLQGSMYDFQRYMGNLAIRAVATGEWS
jgi:hypothetical protein